MNEDHSVTKIANLILDRTGIYFKENKYPILKIKLDKIIWDWGIAGGYDELYDIIIKDNYGERFFDIINEISVNVTEFFRQPEHFHFLQDIFITQFMEKKNPEKTIRAWSAACSTGQEPYSIVISLNDGLDCLENQSIVKPEISVVSSDISHRALEIAIKGVYPFEEASKVCDKKCLKKYFQYGTGNNEGHVKLKDTVMKSIEFRSLNLNSPIPFKNEFDIVFVRNVMIYFSKEKQKEVLEKICSSIKKGGYLFLGYSETILGFSLPLTYIKPSIYQKK
ncbi:MAG: protein-glutamate O-methyltransferase CheR [Spirochaetes bacterium]|nr:protein-glutamate O-methyltransferase CheR [Spirochaetota bacterium]